MIIGVPREIKTAEHRVALVPSGVETLVQRGSHTVLIERGAGEGSGFADEQFSVVGAEIVETAAEVWSRSEMIVKVKEPTTGEFPLIEPGQILFTYFHFAADEALTRAMVESEAIAIAYETVQLTSGELPLLCRMRPSGSRRLIVSLEPPLKPRS